MALLSHAPTFEPATVEQLVHEIYSLETNATPLASERDQNFQLVDKKSEAVYVLKIANAQEDVHFLDAQHALWQHLRRAGIDFCPQIIPTNNNCLSHTVIAPSQINHIMRLVTYLPGKTLCQVRRQSDALLYDLGHKLGRIDSVSADFDHPAAHRDFHWDLACGLDVVEQNRHLISDSELNKLIDRLLLDIQREVVPRFPELRRSVIHNDANDYNVTVGRNSGSDAGGERGAWEVWGILDFGDMVYSYTVGNVAIASAYALLEKRDPLATAAKVVRGYHAAHPLSEAELHVLFGMINLRLCVSICLAALQMERQPENEYLGISQGPIRHTLPTLAAIPYELATALFRQSCGFEAIPSSRTVVDCLRRQTCAPLLGRKLEQEKTVTFNLGVDSPLLHGDAALNGESHLTPTLFQVMDQAKASIGIGQYDEPRLLYTDPMFATGNGPLDERRAIHIGLDLFSLAGNPVYAPLDGIIHAFAVQNNPQDYGGLLILAHETDDGDRFYTIFGHLSHASLDDKYVGQRICAGDEVATLGEPEENGGWPPHLHFQIAVSLLGLGTAFPGVCRASQRRLWTSICPDPNLIVGIPENRFPPPKTTYGDTLKHRKRLLGRNLSLSYRRHLQIARGYRQFLWDNEGYKYLDAYNNVPHVGHCHPRVVAAGQKQMAVLNTNTRYLQEIQNRYAQRLTATMPDPLEVCFLLNSASEANELALRLARSYTGSKETIVTEGAYHGHTTTLIDISPYKHAGPGGSGAPDWVHTVPVADTYRGPYKASDPDAACKYANYVRLAIDELHAQGKKLSCFITESCPSVAGQIIPPAGYLAAIYEQVRAAGGVTIADEVQTGFGRMGEHFYAFEAQQVVPDIVVLGKPMGNGHPIGAVVTTAEIAESFDNGMEFFSTFGGNSVSCAVGLAVLDVVESENLQAHALRVGSRLLEKLDKLKQRYEIVGDVRGSGLFLGLELVQDRESLKPAAAATSLISNLMREERILIGVDGPLYNVLKIRPPMPFNEDDADILVETLELILATEFAD